MKRLPLLVIAACCLLRASVARADEAPSVESPRDRHAERGLTFGARLGLGIPLGVTASPANASSLSGGISQGSTSGLKLPVWLDLAYRITPSWRAGLYFDFGYTTGGFGCLFTCSGYDARFGVDGEYHFAPESHADGWIGAGAGYEILRATSSTVTTAYRGFEFAMLEAGVDYRIRDTAVRWGPFTTLTLARYNHVRQMSSTADVSAPIPNQAFHAWLFLGVRGTFDL